MRHIPNFITSLNLASGFAAVIFILNGHPATASWLILLAMVFDFFDGFASRLLKAYSDMGKELDSLADMVSFGVVPGLLIYSFLCKSGGVNGGEVNFLYLLVSAFYPVCAGLRLAKFNIDTTQATTFRGMPTPAGALAIITLSLAAAYSGNQLINRILESQTVIFIYSLFLSVMMVTRIPLLSLKFHDLKFKGNEGRFLLIAAVVLIAALFRFTGLPLIIPAYLLVSVISLLF